MTDCGNEKVLKNQEKILSSILKELQKTNVPKAGDLEEKREKEKRDKKTNNLLEDIKKGVKNVKQTNLKKSLSSFFTKSFLYGAGVIIGGAIASEIYDSFNKSDLPLKGISKSFEGTGKILDKASKKLSSASKDFSTKIENSFKDFSTKIENSLDALKAYTKLKNTKFTFPNITKGLSNLSDFIAGKKTPKRGIKSDLKSFFEGRTKNIEQTIESIDSLSKSAIENAGKVSKFLKSGTGQFFETSDKILAESVKTIKETSTKAGKIASSLAKGTKKIADTSPKIEGWLTKIGKFLGKIFAGIEIGTNAISGYSKEHDSFLAKLEGGIFGGVSGLIEFGSYGILDADRLIDVFHNQREALKRFSDDETSFMDDVVNYFQDTGESVLNIAGSSVERIDYISNYLVGWVQKLSGNEKGADEAFKRADIALQKSKEFDIKVYSKNLIPLIDKLYDNYKGGIDTIIEESKSFIDKAQEKSINFFNAIKNKIGIKTPETIGFKPTTPIERSMVGGTQRNDIQTTPTKESPSFFEQTTEKAKNALVSIGKTLNIVKPKPRIGFKPSPEEIGRTQRKDLQVFSPKTSGFIPTPSDVGGDIIQATPAQREKLLNKKISATTPRNKLDVNIIEFIKEASDRFKNFVSKFMFSSNRGSLTQKQKNALIKQIGLSESNNIYNAVNTYGYLGKYQLGAGALEDMGLLNNNSYKKALKIGNANVTLNSEYWKKYDPIDFLTNPSLQESTMERWTNELQRRTLLLKNVFNKDTPANLIGGGMMAGHLKGFSENSGLEKLINGIDDPDGFGTTMSKYFNLGQSAVLEAAKGAVIQKPTITLMGEGGSKESVIPFDERGKKLLAEALVSPAVEKVIEMANLNEMNMMNKTTNQPQPTIINSPTTNAPTVLNNKPTTIFGTNVRKNLEFSPVKAFA